MFTKLRFLFILTVVCRVSDFVIATKRADVRGFFTEDNSLNEIEILAGLSTMPINRHLVLPGMEKQDAFPKRDSCVNKIQYLSDWKKLPNSSYKTKTRVTLILELGP